MIDRPPPPDSPAMIYTRTASPTQDSGISSAQESACHALIKAQGYTCIGVRSDLGVSGLSTATPDLQELLQLARAGAFRVLVATSLDRLSRDRAKLENTLSDLSRAGVSVLTVEEGWITSLGAPLQTGSSVRPSLTKGVRGASARPSVSPALVRSIHKAYAAGLSTHDICQVLNSYGS